MLGVMNLPGVERRLCMSLRAMHKVLPVTAAAPGSGRTWQVMAAKQVHGALQSKQGPAYI